MSQELSANTTLSHYRIVSKIGAGGMGEVYLAQDTKLNRKVALKILPADLAANQDRMRRFVQEAKAAAALNHPNIAHIYEIGEHDGVHFIAMEFIDGETLDARINGKPLALNDALAIATQIAEGLSEAHEHGIIHRDIKPANFMIAARSRVKVMDFGVAKVIEAREAISAEAETKNLLTSPGAIIGTMPYMSPEQVKGERLDARTDIFSFGVVLYQMLTGQQPFVAESGAATISAILTKEPPPLAQYLAECPEELQRIVRKCLEKDREQRYQTMRDLALDLDSCRREHEAAHARASQGERIIGGAAFTATASNASKRNFLFSRRALVAGATLTLLVAVALTYMFVFRRATTAPRRPQIRSLAVLPLENLSGDPAQDYFADGMTAALISNLAQVSALKVISRTSVMQYKSAPRPPLPQIAKELGVDGVIEGSVQRSGDQVRINAQLIYAPTDNHLWARSYDRDLRNILSLESEVAQAIVREIQVKLTPMEESRLTSARTVNPLAHEAYLRGHYNYLQGRDNFPAPTAQEQMHEAIAYLQQAIQIDPNYAPAYSGLAGCEQWLASWTAFGVPGNRVELFEASRAHALRAIQLDDSLAEAHGALAWILYVYDWKFSDSQKEYRRAIELNPGQAYPGYYYTLVALGRLDEAKAEAERAVQLDPLTLAHKTAAAGIYNCAGQHDRAASLGALGEKATGHLQFAIARIQQGATEEGIAELRSIVEFTKEDPFFVSFLIWTYDKGGRRTEAVRLLEEAKARSHGQPVRAESMGMLYAAVGDKDHAFEWLQRAVQARDLTFLLNGRCDPRLESLRGDPRFAELIRRIGLPQ
jgi:serine/threonine protein kinase/tetratricopeptide (TPR) repeat protein